MVFALYYSVFLHYVYFTFHFEKASADGTKHYSGMCILLYSLQL